MKKQIIIFAMIFSCNFLIAQNKGNTIIGKWIGTDERNQTAGIDFSENGKAKLLMFNKEMPECDYKVDYQKNPIAIKFIVNQKGKVMTIYSLIEFIDSTTLKWELFPAAKIQPKSFSKNAVETTILLKRKK